MIICIIKPNNKKCTQTQNNGNLASIFDKCKFQREISHYSNFLQVLHRADFSFAQSFLQTSKQSNDLLFLSRRLLSFEDAGIHRFDVLHH